MSTNKWGIDPYYSVSDFVLCPYKTLLQAFKCVKLLLTLRTSVAVLFPVSCHGSNWEYLNVLWNLLSILHGTYHSVQLLLCTFFMWFDSLCWIIIIIIIIIIIWINFYLFMSVLYLLQSFSCCVWLMRKATIFRMRMGCCLFIINIYSRYTFTLLS
jgi:hypothetical protein